MEDYERMLLNQSDANNAFNASQAEINRDWNEYMSSTAHQRETEDLIAAGINPVLSANSGASWNSVSNATADPSSVAAVAALKQTQLNNATNLEMANINAKTALATSQMQSEATKAAANATAGATMAAAANSAAATMAAASLNNEAAHYSADKNYETQTYTSPATFKLGPVSFSGPSGGLNAIKNSAFAANIESGDWSGY